MSFERRRLRVYVAGPISSDVFEGVHRGIRVGRQLLADGLAPYVPHLDAFMFLPQKDNWNAYLEWDLEWSTLAEAVYRLEGESRGADLEVKIAAERGIPVFYEKDVTGYFGYEDLLAYADKHALRGKREVTL